jgi:hypothetical protein
MLPLRGLAHIDHRRSAVDFPGCLAMASPSTLTIGLIDEVQRLHVRIMPLKCIVRVCMNLFPRRFARFLLEITPEESSMLPKAKHTLLQSCAKTKTMTMTRFN